jgi:hypothetical protein
MDILCIMKEEIYTCVMWLSKRILYANYFLCFVSLLALFFASKKICIYNKYVKMLKKNINWCL